MFYFAMKSNSEISNEAKTAGEVLQVRRENLEGQIASLEKQLELANHPLTSERIWRDQLWQKNEGEENLELVGFVYTPRVLAEEVVAAPTIWQQWRALIF